MLTRVEVENGFKSRPVNLTKFCNWVKIFNLSTYSGMLF